MRSPFLALVLSSVSFCYEGPWQPVVYDYYHIDLSEIGGHPQVPHHKTPIIPREAIVDVVNELGIKLLAIHNERNENNIAISPYGAFSVLAALTEGLQGEAAHEILHAAHIPKDKHVLRVGLRDVHRHLKSYFIPEEGFLAGLTLNLNNVTLKSEYEDVLRFYGFDYASFNNALYPEPPTTKKSVEGTTLETGLTISEEETTAIITEKTEEITKEISTRVGASTSERTIADETTTESQSTVTSTSLPTTTDKETTTTQPAAATTTELFSTIANRAAETTTEKSSTTSLSTSTQIPETTRIITTTSTETTTKISETTVRITTETTKPPDETTTIMTTTETTNPPTKTTTTLEEITTKLPETTTKPPPTTTETTLMTTTTPIRTTREVTTITVVPELLTTETITISTELTTILVPESTTEKTTISTEVDAATEDQSTTVMPELTTETITTSFEVTTIVVPESSTTISTEVDEVDAATEDQLLQELETTTPVFFGTTPEFQEMPQTANLDFNYNNYDNANYNENNVPETVVGDNNFKRQTRSVVDYVIARFYDGNHHHYEGPPPRQQYIPQEPLTFAVYGKFRESGINFMKYDTVLPYFYVRNLNAIALSFPLDSSKYYLLLLLPVGDNGVDQLICDLRLHGNLRYIIDNLKLTHVVATIPSFMLKGYVTLTPALQRLGIRKIFEPRQADFSPMTNETDIYVTNIEQAVTVTIRNYLDPSSQHYKNFQQYPPVHFKADHPFLYFVIDSELHVALMIGKVINPLNSRIR